MDPSLNETEVMDDFINGWYGPKGAPVIKAYMQAFYDSAVETNTYLSIFLGVTPSGTAPGEKPPPNPGKAVCAVRNERTSLFGFHSYHDLPRYTIHSRRHSNVAYHAATATLAERDVKPCGAVCFDLLPGDPAEHVHIRVLAGRGVHWQMPAAPAWLHMQRV
jgi:hypothetical protein